MLSHIQTRKPKKNKFDLSHEYKLTGNMGVLYPCFTQEVLPGDSFKVNTQQLLRFSPLLAPVMHRIDFKLDYFYVPYRLIWDEWKDFITGGEDGNDLPSFPRFQAAEDTISYLSKGSLADYLGLPPVLSSGDTWQDVSEIGNADNITLSLLPFRAYQLIYHEYFRDQNVGDEYEQHTSSGIEDSFSAFEDMLRLRRTNWEKDYFTSALPFLQRGNEVTLPLGDVAQVVSNNEQIHFTGTSGLPALGQSPLTVSAGGNDVGLEANSGHFKFGTETGLEVDLDTATSITINELRKASALQQWLELMARAGSRYREQIFAMFGERIPDYTVQVPQYLGGGKTPVMISEVVSTYQSEQSQDRPQGDMTGHAVAVGDNLGFTQSFDEHGIIIGLCRVVPKSSYVQGINRFWHKFDKFDYYFPQFANLGEQEISYGEVFTTGSKEQDAEIWGYQQRYAEYKYAENKIAGDFNDNLSFWELSRRFETPPQLNQSFVECNPDDRIFAINDDNEDKLWISLYHDVKALRPIPYHANPMLT